MQMYEGNTIEPGQLIQRPRLTSLLRGRFDHRVTTLVAPAGSGKTASLTLARRNNELDPVGLDVWVDSRRVDDDPVQFVAAIADALDVGPIPDVSGGLRLIHDAVWSLAPSDVAITIDDLHEVPQVASIDVLTRLSRELPENGHLVLASRSAITVPLARLRAHRRLTEITVADLGLDDAELAELRAQRGAPESVGDLPRHAAAADLQLAVGSDAGIEFLCQEVLTELEPDRLATLRWAALIDDVDDELVVGLSDGRLGLDELVADFPLVERRDDGSRRMHSLLRDALVAGLEPGERRKGLELAAEIQVGRERLADGVRLFHEAGNDIAAREVARQFAMAPNLRQTMGDIASIRRIVDRIAPDCALATALEATERYAGSSGDFGALLEATASAARAEGDEQIEALALHRLNQASYLGRRPLEDRHHDRAQELAAAGGFAAGAAAHFRSARAQFAGDSAASIAAVDDYDHFDRISGTLLRSERLCDLGQPELAVVGLGPDDLEALPEGSEIYSAFAMWMRGDADPALAQAVVSEMEPGVVRRGMPQTSAGILGVGTVIALAAGDIESARRRARELVDLCDPSIGDLTLTFAHVAAAAVAAVDEGDDRAAALLDPATTGVPFGAWPTRGQLLALPLVYVAMPESRPALDAATFGRAHTIAVEAGRALVELRETGSSKRAIGLPWTQTNILRVHVLPPHLAELACAAADAGVEAAESLLMSLPALSANLARVEEVSTEPARRHAARVLGSIPRQAPSTLHAVLLGTPALVRDGEPAPAGDWERSPLVRELCGLLLERRRVHRSELLGLLWPDHDDEGKAFGSLRTVLAKVQKTLEPDRSKDDEPFFLRTVAETLVLDPSFTSDVDEFERHMSSAIADDQAGSPASALVSYQAALAIYDGDYLDGSDAAWLMMTRLRLRSMAASGACRVSELVAARGEPEEAARWAQRARTIEPLDQRAGRLFVSALDAAGNRPAAVVAAQELAAMLSTNGLGADPATTRLLDRLLAR